MQAGASGSSCGISAGWDVAESANGAGCARDAIVALVRITEVGASEREVDRLVTISGRRQPTEPHRADLHPNRSAILDVQHGDDLLRRTIVEGNDVADQHRQWQMYLTLVTPVEVVGANSDPRGVAHRPTMTGHQAK